MWSFLSSVATRRFGLILLYHGVFRRVPNELRGNFHNVSPEVLAAQVDWIGKVMEFVPLDEFMANQDVTGKAAVTFDDAYACVFENAAPILMERGIPFTVFVNGSTLEGRPFWRDKIRYVDNCGLIDEFVAFRGRHKGMPGFIPASSFYRSSKTQHVNSRALDEELDAFAESRGGRETFDTLSRYIARRSDLIVGDGITYGNHSYSHYVMSSLDPAEQRAEIVRNQTVLASLELPLTRTFALPFGGARDFTATTIELLRSTGYSGALYSRNRLNQTRQESQFMAERFMPPDDMGLFHKRLLKACYRTLKPDRSNE